ncbi:hypothetical protein MKY91_19605 [Alkalicoccobacillus gibsonii]|uniref:DUF1430 domain-containing protein n=1 Tax=Alkalicoccobacillus gibsonii TaxID=79881 RepID=A0ABU9VNV3_9BACI
MRKLIFLLLTITLVVISLLTVKQFEYTQFQLFNESDKSGEVWEINILEGNPNVAKTENFQILHEISKELNVNIQRISYEKDDEHGDKMVYYVALSDSEHYFNNLNLINGVFLNTDSNSNEFLSTINTNSNNQIGQLELFKSFDPIEIRPMMAAERKKDIKGVYSLSGTENKDRFKELAISYGFSIGEAEKETQGILTEYPYQDMIYKTTIILFLLIGLATFHDLINNYKAIAIRKLLGFNFFEICGYLIARYLPLLLKSLISAFLIIIVYLYLYNGHSQIYEYLISLLQNLTPFSYAILTTFILTILGIFTINISQMIKNKKPMKIILILNILIRFILSIFLLITIYEGVNTYLTLKNTTSQEEKWEILNDYFFLGIVSESEDELSEIPNDEEKDRNFINFYKELESEGSIYIVPSAYYVTNIDQYLLDPNPWGYDGKRVEINKNYLDINPIYGVDGEQVELTEEEDELIVLVPERYLNAEEDIRQTIYEDFNYVYNDDENIDIEIIYVENNQTYFSYSTYFAEDENYLITDPIAVVVNANFDTSILMSHLAMGYGYYIKNSSSDDPFNQLDQLLDNYGFNDVWTPVSIAYASVESKIATEKELLQLTILTCILYAFLAFLLLFFSSMNYLEMNRQLLSIQRLFGYNLLEKHIVMYLFIIVFWFLILLISSYLVMNATLLTKLLILIVVLDICLITVIIKIKEFQIVMVRDE